MRIGIDILGGDYAPIATVKGSIMAAKELEGKHQVVVIGDKEHIHKICKDEGVDPNIFEIIHTVEHIGMDEYPAKAFTQKPNASIVMGFKLLHSGEIDGFASAGNTGAMLVGGMHVVKSIPGIIRPCITAPVPRLGKKPSVVLDVGINPDCKPDVLYQYGILGSLYSREVYGIENPNVALFNIGKEEEKGNLLTKASYQAMKGTSDFNFVGNIEGTELFTHDVDVIVCDGFVGNTILKVSEAFYGMFKTLMPGKKAPVFDGLNYEQYGGTPILGINKTATIGHGISNELAIKNLVIHTADIATAELPRKIKAVIE